MSSITSFFKSAPKPEDPAAAAASTSSPAAATPAAGPTRYELLFSRTSKVVQWDEGLFTDCRPSEAQDAMDETVRMAKRYDQKEVPDDDEEEGYPSMESFVLPEEAYDGLYDSVTEANELAKQFVEMQLEMPLNCEIARQEQVANGELPHGYQLPTADTVAKEMAMSKDGCATYTGSVPFFCDPYGADVWTVCVSTFTVRVVVEGDRSPLLCAAAPPAAAAKNKAGKAKQPVKKSASSSKTKSISKSTAVSKPARRGGGGGPRILSVPGLSKKEVAALNQAARASAKRMAMDSDDDW